MTNFVVLATQRTGSTWVVDTLSIHPNVVAHSELFLADGSGRPMWGSADTEFYATFARLRASADQAHTLSEYLDHVYAPRPGIDAIGFKLMYGQCGANDGLLDLLASRGARFVHLVRSNALDVVISRQAAVARDLFHAAAGTDVPDLRFALDVSDLRRHLEGLVHEAVAARKKLEQAGVTSLEVSYEALCFDHMGFADILRFLGVRVMSLQDRVQKVLHRDHDAILENIDEVDDLLAGTEFGWMIRRSPG